MKWFDPPKTIEGLKKRGQLYLLLINIIIATTNFFVLVDRLERPQGKMVLLCRTINFTDTACLEQ